MGKHKNIEVFEDTMKQCKENEKIKKSLNYSVKRQEIILEVDDYNKPNLDIFKDKAKIVVSKKRTLEAASFYKGSKTAVLNFASATNPGGGVVNGSSAQEECICRCSGLYLCLNIDDVWNVFYHPHRNAHFQVYNDDIVYTPDVEIFKTDTCKPELMDENDWYKVDIITCAAPNIRALKVKINRGEIDKSVILENNLLKIHEKRLKKILDVAVSHGVETIILGAYGCGAFGNSPEIVATAAKNVLKDYMYAFKNIEYAVYCGPKDDTNYTVFNRIIK